MRPLLLISSCVALLSGCQPASQVIVQASPTAYQDGLVVTGTATVRVQPTLVVLKLGVSNSDARPATSKSQTEETIKKVINAVKSAGVDASDVQTTSFTLTQNFPRTSTTNRFATSAIPANGWVCSSNIEVRVKQIDKASSVLEAAMNAGANRVSSVEYTVEELQEVRAKARDEACQVAKAKAEQYARNFGVKLGKPKSISENTPYGWFYRGNTLSQSVVNDLDGTPNQAPDQVLSSGSVEVTLTVNVTYGLE